MTMSHDKISAMRAAEKAASRIRKVLNVEHPEIGLVLGTGWGDCVHLDDAVSLPFGSIDGFGNLPPELEGHARRVEYGRLGGVPVVALRGRVHLNEAPFDTDLYRMVRLQTEMLCQLGVRKLILTCAAGALAARAEVGDVVAIDGFVTAFAPDMPLYGGEFVSPEDALSEDLLKIAHRASYKESRLWKDIAVRTGGHVMLRGPFFEGRGYDKPLLAETGASVVGMSVLPEACIAALYGVDVLALAFITNSDTERHSHEENRRRAKEAADSLGTYLGRVVSAASARDTA